MTLTAEDFDFLRAFVYANSAIVLDPGKEYLVTSRLGPVAQKEGLGGVDELVRQLRRAPPERLRKRVIDAMTTNETSFFRDMHPFETLRTEILPRVIAKRSPTNDKPITIWSAAASSGQEAYTIAMVMREHYPDRPVRILASDLSTEILDRAKAGVYSQVEVNRGLPAPKLFKWFEPDRHGYRVRDELRTMVEFFQLNLVGPWPFLPQMDVIFLRNVLIYFDQDTKRAILAKMRRQLGDGYLVLGGAETTLNLDDNLEIVPGVKSHFYRNRVDVR